MRVAILTSGGDSPGMNASVRSVARLCLQTGWDVFGVQRGYRGLVEGGDAIQPLRWSDLGGILQRGGTFLGTARSKEFREVEGRRQAAKHLREQSIEGLVVVGGDGSLSGAQVLYNEWADLLGTPEGRPRIVGLPGSIDNDLPGTDVSIGADTALHRIVEAVDRITSTAASHNRIFVVEVMGRRCGYLTLMAALATGAEAALIPESPLSVDWKDRLCWRLAESREAGRTSSMVLVAEGARDHEGKPIRPDDLRALVQERLGEEARVSILGHIQRGGAPSAFDRNLGALLAVGAVQALAEDGPPVLIGLRGNSPAATNLEECLEQARKAVEAVDARREQEAISLRGTHFAHSLQARRLLVQARPRAVARGPRIGLIHVGAPAAGMNMADRVAVRTLLESGHRVVGIHRGLKGLVEGDLRELGWMDVTGWSSRGGAELGTSRKLLTAHELYAVSRLFQEKEIQGLLMIGGLAAYQTAVLLRKECEHYPGLALPVLCVPASIDNNLPGTELSLGADTALNVIVEMVDRIKQSAVASQRCFVVEVMGRDCGYLALMAALATGAERVYLPESGITIHQLLDDLKRLADAFRRGRRVGVVIRNESANPLYTTDFIASLYEEESRGAFDVRRAILGHIQQGGDPTPFDRTLAVRLTMEACHKLQQMVQRKETRSLGVGIREGHLGFVELPAAAEPTPWWFGLRDVAERLGHEPDPASPASPAVAEPAVSPPVLG